MTRRRCRFAPGRSAERPALWVPPARLGHAALRRPAAPRAVCRAETARSEQDPEERRASSTASSSASPRPPWALFLAAIVARRLRGRPQAEVAARASALPWLAGLRALGPMLARARRRCFPPRPFIAAAFGSAVFSPSAPPPPPTLASASAPAPATTPSALSWSVAQRVAYRLDLWLEQNPSTYFFVLLFVTSLWVVFGAVVYYFARNNYWPLSPDAMRTPPLRPETAQHPPEQPDWDAPPVPVGRVTFREALWRAWSCLASSSTHTKEKEFRTRIVTLLLTLGGLVSYSVMTGTVSATMKQRLEVLRRGTILRPVVESGQVIVVGSNKSVHVAPLLKQLDQSAYFAQKAMDRKLGIRARFRLGDKRQTVVLVGNSGPDLPDVGARLRKEMGRLKLLTRAGSVNDPRVFSVVGARSAKQVVVLKPQTDTDPYDADAQALGTLMALHSSQCKADIVMEVSKGSTASLVDRISKESSFASVTVILQNLGPKVMAQCALQPGLHRVFYELMSHAGTVINVRDYPSLTGLTYGNVRRGFRDAVLCGLIHNGQTVFHPKESRILVAGDKLMVLAGKHTHRTPPMELDHLAMSVDSNSKKVVVNHRLTGRQSKDESHRSNKSPRNKEFRRDLVLVAGWNNEVADMLIEWDTLSGSGSEVRIVSKVPVEERSDLIARKVRQHNMNSGSNGDLKNIQVKHFLGNPLSRTDMTLAILASNPQISNGSVAAVSVPDNHNAAVTHQREFDNRTVMSSLIAEDIFKDLKIPARICAEVSNGSIARSNAKVHPGIDFVCVADLLGLFTAQVVEHSYMNAVWSELLVSEGSEIYIKNWKRYARSPSRLLTFEEAKERATELNETAIGIHRNEGGSWVPIVNPDGSTRIGPEDRVIVISEDQMA